MLADLFSLSATPNGRLEIEVFDVTSRAKTICEM